ncbi:FG-GAP repeat protein [Streptomyces sp. NPDC005322]|uniref:FG-GAP repeat protein n=1 Tax=Streptomyces sp. NPDC005322 TaxID=3157032 RepID=UPI00339E5A3A
MVGDINGDGKDDVVIGTGFSDGPEDYLLRTFPGSVSGIDAAGAVVWTGGPHQGTAARLGGRQRRRQGRRRRRHRFLRRPGRLSAVHLPRQRERP